MNHSFKWPVGVELEYIAGAYQNRYSLGEHLREFLQNKNASLDIPYRDLPINSFFNLSSEPDSLGKKTYHSLERGVMVGRYDQFFAKMVDDITISDGLPKEKSHELDWYRVVSDDVRIITLLSKLLDANATIDQVLSPLSNLIGAEVVVKSDASQSIYIADKRGETYAAALPGLIGRSRVAEIISPVLNTKHLSLEKWLAIILGFADLNSLNIAGEAALHMHFDGSRLQSPEVFKRLFDFCDFSSKVLRDILPPNSKCIRLGTFSDFSKELSKDLSKAHSWGQVCDLVKRYPIGKFYDFNLWNLIVSDPEKCTFEVRMLPPVYREDFIVLAYKVFSTALTNLVYSSWNAKAQNDFTLGINQLSELSKSSG